MILFNKRNWVF